MCFGRLVAVLGCPGDAYGFGVVLGVFRKFLGDVLGVSCGRLGVSFWMFCEQLGLFRALSYPRASLIELRSGVARDMCF